MHFYRPAFLPASNATILQRLTFIFCVFIGWYKTKKAILLLSTKTIGAKAWVSEWTPFFYPVSPLLCLSPEGVQVNFQRINLAVYQVKKLLLFFVPIFLPTSVPLCDKTAWPQHLKFSGVRRPNYRIGSYTNVFVGKRVRGALSFSLFPLPSQEIEAAWGQLLPAPREGGLK